MLDLARVDHPVFRHPTPGAAHSVTLEPCAPSSIVTAARLAYCDARLFAVPALGPS
jgi:hypothetical protein